MAGLLKLINTVLVRYQGAVNVLEKPSVWFSESDLGIEFGKVARARKKR